MRLGRFLGRGVVSWWGCLDTTQSLSSEAWGTMCERINRKKVCVAGWRVCVCGSGAAKTRGQDKTGAVDPGVSQVRDHGLRSGWDFPDSSCPQGGKGVGVGLAKQLNSAASPSCAATTPSLSNALVKTAHLSRCKCPSHRSGEHCWPVLNSALGLRSPVPEKEPSCQGDAPLHRGNVSAG